VIELIRPYFEQWGYLIVFAVCLLENSAFVGAIVPGDVVLLLAGFYVQRSSLDLAPVIVLALIGAVIGDTIGYFIGRTAGRGLVDRFGKHLLPARRLERMDLYFEHYGMWAVTIGRFAPLVRTVNTFAAGLAKMPFHRFLVAVIVAASIWSVAMPAAGFLFSDSLERVRSTIGWAGVGILIVFGGGLVWTYRRMTKRLADGKH
jgi:membrane protein DedA with SNARE-associated domain